MNSSSAGELALIAGCFGAAGPHGFGITAKTTRPNVAKAN